MYGGFAGTGGTPDADIWHGQYVADFAVTGETYDTNEPATQRRIMGIDDCVARFECEGEVAFGLTESTAGAYEAAIHGRGGLSLAP